MHLNRIRLLEWLKNNKLPDINRYSNPTREVLDFLGVSWNINEFVIHLWNDGDVSWQYNSSFVGYLFEPCILNGFKVSRKDRKVNKEIIEILKKEKAKYIDS